MNDVFKEFSESGNALGGGMTYAHPRESQILEECSALLSEIPEGRRLLAFAKDNNVKIHVITGKDPANTVFDMETIHLVCPQNTAAVNLHEMVMNLALGIKELEMVKAGEISLYLTNVLSPEKERQLFKKAYDTLAEMCLIAQEYENTKQNLKYVDFIKKLGHHEFYKGYVSGESYESLRQRLTESL